MSKSLKRVRAALDAASVTAQILEVDAGTRTAQEAAEAGDCHLDQIVKSIIFQGRNSGTAILFLTAGGNLVDGTKASDVAGEPLGKADAGLVRVQTGFAIGGVAPIGHLNPIRAFFDPRLLDFDIVWAAAGTPRHIFAADPNRILQISNGQLSDFVQ